MLMPARGGRLGELQLLTQGAAHATKEREEIQVVQMSGVLIQVTRTSGTNLERRHQHRHEADVLARVDAVCARVWSGLQAQSWVPDAREALADLRDHHLTKALG
ncbi:MAG: hypothetical protein EB104_06820 [Acidimicrobiia bacterium]|nr:hypothetical protein [Acidimicrobiia bacterium]